MFFVCVLRGDDCYTQMQNDHHCSVAGKLEAGRKKTCNILKAIKKG